jgi:hypothetical protein
MRLPGFLLLSSFLLCSMARAAEPSILGDWYEDETYGGRRVIAVGHFHNDGTFSVDFRTCLQHNTTLDHTDTGTYTYAGGKLEMITTARNGFWVYDIEDYQTVSNNGRLWIYKSTSGDAFKDFGQVTFHDVRVTPDSKTPDCALTG